MALRRGKQGNLVQPKLGTIRALVRADLSLLTETRTQPSTLQRLRDPHHRIARCVAAGMRNYEVAAHCGISYNRVSILQSDPAFMDLVAKYRGQIDEAFIRQQDVFMEVATSNMLKAEAMIAEKLEAAEETGEFLPTRDLLAISRDAADRFGYGKKNTNVNVNVDFAAMLEKARARSDAARTIGSSSSRASIQSEGGGTDPAVSAPALRRV